MRHRHDQGTKERAGRMFEQRREEQPQEPRKKALVHLSGLLGVPPDTIPGWVDRARVDSGEKPGVTTAEREEIKALRRELAEVKRANEILKTASLPFRRSASGYAVHRLSVVVLVSPGSVLG